VITWSQKDRDEDRTLHFYLFDSTTPLLPLHCSHQHLLIYSDISKIAAYRVMLLRMTPIEGVMA
jgi:hypothetical protein